MWWITLLFAFVVALILAGLLVGGVGWRHPGAARPADAWGAGLFVFLLLLLFVWSAALWVPAGPVVWDVYWVPPLAVGLFVALILAAAVPVTREPPGAPPRSVEETPPPGEATPPEEPEATAAGLFGVFFWVLLVGLAIAIIVGIMAD